MCYDDIHRKLIGMEYAALADVEKDFGQMFWNAKK